MLPTLRRNGWAYAPLSDFNSLRREMDQFMDSWSGNRVPRGGSMLWTPSINVREDQDAFHIEAELPGVDPDDVEISLEDRVLTISGEKRSASEREGESYHVAERSYGRFERSFTLGRTVDADAIEARFDQGVLHVSIPKPEEQKPRRIQIRAEAGADTVEPRVLPAPSGPAPLERGPAVVSGRCRSPCHADATPPTEAGPLARAARCCCRPRTVTAASATTVRGMTKKPIMPLNAGSES